MRRFDDDAGRSWTAAIAEESTPRHHGRWYLVFRPGEAGDGGGEEDLPMSEVRWQSAESARRTLRTMSERELRRRVASVLGRYPGHGVQPR